MRVSVLLATASGTYNASHETLKDVSVFEPLAASLEAQRLPPGVSIEVVVVDSLAGQREPDAMAFLPPGTVYVRAPEEWCFKNRLRHHQADKNAALASATGQVCYMIDDWCWFDHDPDHLARILDYNRRGYFLGTLYDWRFGDDPDIETPFQGRDWREEDWPRGKEWLGGSDPMKPPSFGVQAYSRAAVLDIGGYDEAYDAGSGFGDLDLGIRLQVACRRKLALDKEHKIRHQRHGPQDPDVVSDDVIKCNRALYFARQRLAEGGALDPVVNKPLHPAIVEVLNSAQCMFCSAGEQCDFPYRGEVHPQFQEWLANLPNYDLRRYASALRKQRRLRRRDDGAQA